MTGIYQFIGIGFKSDISRKSYGHRFFFVSTPFLLVKCGGGGGGGGGGWVGVIKIT